MTAIWTSMKLWPCVLCIIALAGNAVPCVAGQIMFWADQGNIFRANLDGGNVQQISDANVNGWAGWLDVNASSQRLYFRGGSDADGGSGGVIRSMDFDGSGVANVVTGLNFAGYGMALDVPNNRIYFGDHAMGIFTTNLDGSNLQALPGTTTEPNLLRHTHDIEVASATSQVYYTNAEFTFFNRFNGIRQANLDGSSIQDVLNNGNAENLVAVMLALNEQAGNLYWSIEPTGEIWKANLDGSGASLFLSGISGIYDLEVDADAGKLYFTSRNSLGRVNLDGTGLENLVTLSGARFHQGLVLATEATAVPEPSATILLGVGSLALAFWRRRKIPG